MPKYLTKAQKLESKAESNRKTYAKNKQRISTDKKLKTANRARSKAFRTDPEHREKTNEYQKEYQNTDRYKEYHKEYQNTDRFKDSNRASHKKWRQSDKSKAYFSKKFEALRLAFVQEWRDWRESDADCDCTQDDLDYLESTNGDTICAEVDRFLSEVKLVDGPCKGYTFTV
jgi:hypothetical protein